MSEQAIETMIQDKGLDAPRLKPEDIDAMIKTATYTVLQSGKCMACEITLRNGFTVLGCSACVSKDNFDMDVGREISFHDARNKIWELEGYLLLERMYLSSTRNEMSKHV